MAMAKRWKVAEQKAAALIGGRRYWANSGEPIDCESTWAIAQVKDVKTCSLAALEALALEAERQGTQRRKIGMVVIRRHVGRGTRTPRLVVLTEAAFTEMSGALPDRAARRPSAPDDEPERENEGTRGVTA
jgi:hypothetical protein